MPMIMATLAIIIAILIARMAIIMAIHGNTKGINNGHKWHMLMAHHGSANGHHMANKNCHHGK